MKKLGILVATLLLVAGCRQAPPDTYLELTGRIFIFNYRVATATYVITFSKTRLIPDGATMLTTFDDPAGGAKIEVRQKVWPKMEKIAIESPPVFCIVKDRPYAFQVSLFGPDGTRLQEITGTVISNLDQTILPDRPLVVGPVYTPNPELKGNPGGKLPGQEIVKCKLE
jgi:hypothetical protein